jgi:hypothetical protein
VYCGRSSICYHPRRQQRLAVWLLSHYLLGMPSAPRKSPSKRPTAAKLRSWRVSVLRTQMQYRGDVQAPDQRSAEAEAVRQFKLSDDERKRLVLQERDQT